MSKFLDDSGLAYLWTKIKAYIDGKVAETQTSGNWSYKIYADGSFDAWYYKAAETWAITYASGNMYRSDPRQFNLPTDISGGTVFYTNCQIFHPNYPVWGAVAQVNPPKVQALSGAQRTSNSNHTTMIHVSGKL